MCYNIPQFFTFYCRTGTMVEYGSKYDIKFDNLSIKQSKTESVADDGKINLSHVEEERLWKHE